MSSRRFPKDIRGGKTAGTTKVGGRHTVFYIISRDEEGRRVCEREAKIMMCLIEKSAINS